MTTVRKSAVSGIFYPDQELKLQSKVQELLSEAPVYSQRPMAVVAPHSAISYSGAVAASAYASLAQFQDEIKDVVILGSSHHKAVKGIVASSYTEFDCGFGTIKTNAQTLEKAKQLSFVSVDDTAHRDEHSIEVQLPFLKEVLGEFTVTPLIVGEVEATEVASLIEALVDSETLFVISSDLSQYLPYDEANEVDEETLKALESLDTESLNSYKACNCTAVQGLLEYAKLTKSTIKNVFYQNSGDTGANKDRVIGFASSFCMKSGDELSVTNI